METRIAHVEMNELRERVGVHANSGSRRLSEKSGQRASADVWQAEVDRPPLPVLALAPLPRFAIRGKDLHRRGAKVIGRAKQELQRAALDDGRARVGRI